MDESYHDLLAAGVEAKYRALEMSIMDDIIRRIRKAGTITDAADWQIQRLVILGNSTQDIKEDITIAQCKYQALLNDYKSFSKFMGIPVQTERIYTGRTTGRISPSPKVFAQWQAKKGENNG